MRKLIQTSDVAVALDRTERTVARWCREGRIPCLKLGRKWVIPEDELNRFIEDALTGTEPAAVLTATPPAAGAPSASQVVLR